MNLEITMIQNFHKVTIALLLIIITGCATINHHPAKIERKYYNNWEKDIGYAQVVQSSNTLYLSGITSTGKSLSKQLDGIYTTIANILADYGSSTNHIVKEVIYTKNMEELKKAIPVRKNILKVTVTQVLPGYKLINFLWMNF